MRAAGTGVTSAWHARQHRSSSRGRRAVRALLLLVALLAASACGGDANETSGRAEQLLTSDDVQAYEEGTPEHALLDWWRHSQYRDLHGFLHYFRAAVRRKHADSTLSRRKLELLAQVLRHARPDILETERRGDQAVIWTRVRSRLRTGENRYVPSSTPFAFSMIREDGEWRFVDDYFFESVAEARRERRHQEGD